MRKEIDNTQDILDSRDIIERFNELREEREALQEELTDAQDEAELADDGDEKSALQARINAALAALTTWDEENAEELRILEDVNKQGEECAEDWPYGETLIRDSYFKTFAQEFADDIGAIDANARWPLSCIDWDQAARELQMDYSAIEFDGVTYWIR